MLQYSIFVREVTAWISRWGERTEAVHIFLYARLTTITSVVYVDDLIPNLNEPKEYILFPLPIRASLTR
jgi:hypothetical protein